MDKPVYVPDYAYDVAPKPGGTVEVAPGVHWLRTALPFKLDHINLWLLDDSDDDGYPKIAETLWRAEEEWAAASDVKASVSLGAGNRV